MAVLTFQQCLWAAFATRRPEPDDPTLRYTIYGLPDSNECVRDTLKGFKAL
jgi:hypothetical protein